MLKTVPFCVNISGDDGLRLIGLVAQGSIPWASVGLIALFQIALLRAASWKLSVPVAAKEVMPMRKMIHLLRLVGCSVLETIWAIEASSAAGALPA